MRTVLDSRRPLDIEALLRVVDRWYAAGCAETSWDRPIEELCHVGGFGACALTGVDPLEQRAALQASHGLSVRAASGGSPVGIPLNPLLTDGVLRSPPGTVWHDRRIMSPVTLATTSFWTRWMQPNGFASWICAIVDREHRQIVCLEVFLKPEGALPHSAAVDLLDRLAPHLTRAWRLGKAVRANPQQGAGPLAAARWPEPGPAASLPPEVTPMTSMVQLRAAFGLSKAEARLALHLAAGESLASMAEAFDVKLSTIRSQLQQVFGKTGTSRQAELVALLLSHGYVTASEPAPEPAGGRAEYSLPML